MNRHDGGHGAGDGGYGEVNHGEVNHGEGNHGEVNHDGPDGGESSCPHAFLRDDGKYVVGVGSEGRIGRCGGKRAGGCHWRGEVHAFWRRHLSFHVFHSGGGPS